MISLNAYLPANSVKGNVIKKIANKIKKFWRNFRSDLYISSIPIPKINIGTQKGKINVIKRIFALLDWRVRSVPKIEINKRLGLPKAIEKIKIINSLISTLSIVPTKGIIISKGMIIKIYIVTNFDEIMIG